MINDDINLPIEGRTPSEWKHHYRFELAKEFDTHVLTLDDSFGGVCAAIELFDNAAWLRQCAREAKR